VLKPRDGAIVESHQRAVARALLLRSFGDAGILTLEEKTSKGEIMIQ